MENVEKYGKTYRKRGKIWEDILKTWKNLGRHTENVEKFGKTYRKADVEQFGKTYRKAELWILKPEKELGRKPHHIP